MVDISIIIPVYNMEKFLQESLESVINQIHKNIEIICIDDCSTDNSLNILNEYRQKDKRIKVFSLSEKHTTGFARNLGLENAKGKYIMFLDSDDWFELNACKDALEQISKYDNDLVIFDFYFYKQKLGKKVLQEITKNLDKNNQQINPKSIPECTTNRIVVCNIYKKDFLLKNNIKFTDTISGEDQPFSFACFLHAESISLLHKPLYNFRKYRNAKPARCFERWNDIYINWEKNYDLLQNSPKKDYFLNTYISFLITELIKRYHFCKCDAKIRQIIFTRSREFLIKIVNENDIDKIKENIDYIGLKNFINSNNWKMYELKENLFIFKKLKNNCIIKIFGIKISWKINNT